MMLLVAAALAASCVPVDGERIGAAEMAAADSAFAALPPEFVLGHAPAPGVHRTVAASELAGLAARYGFTRAGQGSVCFERRARRLTPERIIEAMRRTLRPETRIEILDFVRVAVPEGELQFPLNTLALAVDGTVMWRGFVRRTENLRTPVWAKARIRGSFRQVVAVNDLKPGRPVPESAVRLETREGVPSPGAMAERTDQVVGSLVSRIVRAGSPVPLDALVPPNEVARGEVVSVEVRCGAARLVLDALAAADGRKGQIVTVRNPASGKVFRARVEERHKVVALAGGCQ